MWNKREWIIFITAFVFLALFTKTIAVSANDASRMAAIQSIVEKHTFAIDDSSFVWTIDKVFVRGHFYSNKPVFSYLIAVPFYYFLYKSGIGFSGHPKLCYYLITLFTIGLSTSILLVYFYKLLAIHNLNARTKLLYTFALGLGTLIFPYSVVFNNHALAAMFSLVSFYLVLNEKNPVFAGLMAGLMFSVDIVTGIFLMLFLLLVLRNDGVRNAFLFFLGSSAPVILFSILNLRISGSVLPFYNMIQFYNYPGAAFNKENAAGFATQPLSNLLNHGYEIIIGNNGFFSYTPQLLFSFAGLAFAVFKKNRHRKEAVIVAAGVISTLLFYIIKTSNEFDGCAYGFRYAVPLIPVLYFFTPVFFEQKIRFLPLFKILFWLALVFSIFLSAIGSVDPWTCNSRMIPML